jgi:hypothetical protein
MDVLRHDNVTNERKAVLRADLAEDLDEIVSREFGTEERKTAIATASDEVEMTGAVTAFKTLSHGGSGYRILEGTVLELRDTLEITRSQEKKKQMEGENTHPSKPEGWGTLRYELVARGWWDGVLCVSLEKTRRDKHPLSDVS